MDEPKKLWMNLAPYWKYLEDRHMSRNVAEKILPELASPVLVIGAGQGLIVKYLKDRGLTVDGVDIEPEMIKHAKRRHGIDIIKGDAHKLPFKDKSYKSVIISSGVVDYNEDEKSIKQIINEALRVTGSHGNLFVSFYQVQAVLEKIFKKIGVIDKNNYFHYGRLFFIDDNSAKPFNCVHKIIEWTDKKFFPTLLYWGKLGLTLPKELKEEQKNINYIFDMASKENIDKHVLRECFPNNIPYRSISDIEKILYRLKLSYSEIEKFDECNLVKFYKSAFSEIKKADLFKNVKDKDCIVNIESMSKQYKNSDRFAVDSFSLKIKKGSIFGLLGPNGAGKTTALSILCGVMKPTSGKVEFSKELSGSDIKKKIGYIPQELALYPRLTARENLWFFGRLYDVDKKALKEKTEELLDVVKLKDRGNDYVRNFSVGMMRRLNLAIGLVNEPSLILMDEPTVGIDPQSRNHIFDLILSLKKKGVTIIYTTHYIEEANKLCDTVAIMDKGKILLAGSPRELVGKYGYSKIIFNYKKQTSKELIRKFLNIDSVVDVYPTGGNIIFVTTDQSKTMNIIEKVHKVSKSSKFKMSLVEIINPSLETLFLDLTGRGLRDFEESKEYGVS